MGTTKTITVAIDVVGKLDKLSNGLKQVQNQLGNFDLTAGLEKEFSSTLTKLFKQIDRASELSSGGKLKLIDEKAFNKAISNIENAYDELISKLERQGVNTSFLKEDAKVLKTLTNLQNKYEEKIRDSLKEQKKLTRELEKAKNNLADGPKIAKGKTPVDQATYDSLKDTERKLHQAYKKAEQERKDAETAAIARANSDSKYGGDITGKNFKLTKEGKALTAATKEATKAAEDYNKQVKLVESTVLQSRVDEAWEKLKENVAKAEQNLNNFNQSQNNIKTQAIDDLKNSLSQITDINWDEIGIDINKINSIEDFENILAQIGTDSAKRAAEALKQIKGETTELDTPLKQAAAAARESSNALHEMASREREIEDLQRRLISFFSIDNTIQLFKRAVRDAYETVKELDAAATETAVVTDFSVSDMWDQLPRYTEEANKLGTTTLGAYETMTLFYQQGLKTNEAFEIGAETMKMARIANMDYAVATDKMTAALRGFNMELNQTSAQRVNDVYSELAAITAADTNEIATAMTKTASIADSANMEFETTAAFLSQIIETTRESAETAGTAMKTVVARFQELKKDPAEIGEVDGEIVDANKIETALRTINVALRDTSGQFRDLDDVFLEIASKWNTLDTNTQRYIATMAAGSRQQSRFIAMMSNYDRTMELVNAANNSAGASQRQFEKTTESLESKLNKLKNAWNAFTMGITNSEVIKFGVDLLTTFLTVVNKLIDGISGGNGLIKSLLSLSITLGGLSIGKNLVIGLSADLAKTFTKLGKEGSNAWSDGLESGFKSSGKNIQKIVKNIFNKDFWKGGFDLQSELSKQLEELEISYLNTPIPEIEYNLQQKAEEWARLVDIKDASIEQQALYNALIKQNIPIEKAANLVAANASEVEIKQAIATQLGTQATEKKVKEVYEEVLAERAAIALKNKGILTSIKETAKILINTKAQDLNNKEKREAIRLSLIQAGIQPKLASGLLRIVNLLKSPTFWGVTAAVTALGTAFYLLWKNSPAQQLKEAQEAAIKAGEAAQETADKYNNLKSSLEELKDKHTALDDLTKGTQEWNDAVFELNQQMLELIKTYPQLSEFIRNEGGVLTIDYKIENNVGKNFNEVIGDIYTNTLKASAAAIGAEIYANEKEIENKYSELSTELRDYGHSTVEFASKIGELGIIGKEETEEADLAKIIQFLNEQGYSGAYAERMANQYLREIDTLQAFGKEIRGITSETETYKKSIIAQADLIADLKNKGYSDGITKASSAYSEYINDFTKEKEFGFDKSINEQLALEYANIMGYKFKNLRIAGMAATFTKEDGTKVKVSRKQIEEELAAADIAEKLGIEQEKFAKALQESGSNIKKFTMGATNRNLLNEDLKDEFIKAMDGILNEDVAAEYFDKLYNEQKALFTQAENILFGNDEEGRAGVLNKESTDEKAIENRLGSTALSGLADNLYNVLVTQGKEAANKLYGEINKITSSMDDETAQNFVAALNGIDWSSQSSIESFKNQLKEFGVSLPEEEVDSFIDNMKDTTKAIDELTFEQLQEKLLGLKEVIDNVISKIEDDINKFNQEEIDSLISTGIVDREDFYATGIDEYVYLGDTENLLVAINNNVAEILGIQKGRLEDSLNKANEVERFMSRSDDSRDFFTYETSTGEQGTLKSSELLQKVVYDSDFANSLSKDSLALLANQMGAISYEERESGYYGVKELIDKILEQYQHYQQKDTTQTQLNEQNAFITQQQDYQHRSHLFTENGKTFTPENEDYKRITDALEAQARGYGVTESKIQEFKKALEANNGVLDDATEAIIANAIEDKKAEKALGSLTTKVSEITDEYEDLSDITEEDIIKIGEAFGLEELTKDSESFNFIKENLDIIADGVTGDIQKLSEFQEKLAEYYGFTLEGNANLLSLETDLKTVDEQTRTLIENLLKAGLFEIEYVKVEQGQEYLEPFYDKLPNGEGTFLNYRPKTAEVSGYATVIKPVDAPSIKNATGNKTGTSTRKSSSGGSSKSWENPYDKFYNLTETINKNLREREKLERTYNKLLREQKHILNTIEYEKNLSDQINNLKQQADKLRREYALQSAMYSGKSNELQNYMANNAAMRKYAYYDPSTQQIIINWNAIDKVKDDEKGQEIEDYIRKLEELRDAMWDAEDAMWDAEDQIEQMKEELRDKLEELKQAYLDFEDRIVEALVAQRQAEIDELQEVYDLMSESNSSVLSAIQEVISEQRRLRELEEQKANIEEMQRRLAMLRQDTSGASDLEIRALEEQIGDAQQSYTDSLIDQAIDEMGTANEKAEEQRQQQIDLLQHQLDWDKENGKFWAQVNELLSTAINPDGSLNNNSPLVELLKSTEGYKAMSEFGKQNWWTNLQKTVAEAMAGLKEWLDPTDVDAEIGGPGGGDGSYPGDVGGDDGSSGGSGGSGGSGSGILAEGPNVKTLQRFLKDHWEKDIEDDGFYGSKTKKAVKEIQKTLNNSGAVSGGRIQEDGLYGADTQNAIRLFYSRTGRSNISIPAPIFKTGGLADFTGPAWLDGTKSHPEIVLNARDTANFLELRDILRDMNLVSEGKTSGGDNYFEIHIEVDTLSNDYDVEQVADKVKRIINDDARYRNTNAINLIR